MKKLFLTSLFNEVGDKIAALIGSNSTMEAAFIPTAADVYETKPWMEADRKKLIDLGFKVVDYDIKDKTAELIYLDLKEKDIIFVSGGNSFYLLHHALKSGLDVAIKKLLDDDKIYVGSSAGSILLGPTIEPVISLDNSQQAPKLKSFDGLGLVNFVTLPHYGKSKYEERHQKILKEWSTIVNLVPLDDKEFIKVEDEKYEIVEG